MINYLHTYLHNISILYPYTGILSYLHTHIKLKIILYRKHIKLLETVNGVVCKCIHFAFN